jgi:hypothetical protein
MGEGGFRYLMNNGIWYADAHHAHANTETIVGHTTLATGADPAVHGMIGNVWLDRQTGKLTYNIEDPKYRILTPGADVNKATEIDPTQKVASTEGRSPNAILGSTFGDELAIYTAGRAKIFGVSIKDRGAVSMAGHAGKAFWFSKASGEFVTSSYYYDRYPASRGNCCTKGPRIYSATLMMSLGKLISPVMGGSFRILMVRTKTNTSLRDLP